MGGSRFGKRQDAVDLRFQFSLRKPAIDVSGAGALFFGRAPEHDEAEHGALLEIKRPDGKRHHRAASRHEHHAAAVGKQITTLEGLGTAAEPSAVQAAFMDEQAAQCGYCSNGMILSATALLRRNPNPSVEEIREALDAYLCRCGTHTRIIKAVRRAAESSA